MFTSEELKYAQTLGVEIDIIESWSFQNSNSLFKHFVNDFYAKKSEADIFNSQAKIIYKLILNNLYGIIGFSQEQTSGTFFKHNDTEGFAELDEHFDIIETIPFGETLLVKHNFNEFQKNTIINSQTYFNDEPSFANVAISAFITA